MVLSVSLGKEGYIKEIHAVNSLSPALDKLGIDTVLEWKFKCSGTNANASLEDLRLKFLFRPTCGIDRRRELHRGEAKTSN